MGMAKNELCNIIFKRKLPVKKAAFCFFAHAPKPKFDLQPISLSLHWFEHRGLVCEAFCAGSVQFDSQVWPQNPCFDFFPFRVAFRKTILKQGAHIHQADGLASTSCMRTANSSIMCCVELALKGVLSNRLGSKGTLKAPLSLRRFDDYAMLMSPNKGETAGCHSPDGMALRMREVLARPWVGICVTLVVSLGDGEGKMSSPSASGLSV